jgi:hypothetical protein
MRWRMIGLNGAARELQDSLIPSKGTGSKLMR